MHTPRSRFVRNAIAVLPFPEESRSYVHDLLQIEAFALVEPTTWIAGMLDDHLRARYPDAHDAIVRELAPSRHARERDERRAKAREESMTERRAEQAERRRRARDLRLWRKLGGVAPR